jgi:hypothetical protein
MRTILAIAGCVRFRCSERKVPMLKLATVSLVMLLSVSARAASPAPRVVILDALQLTPGLERMNARQRILEAVTGTVQEHGWEPVLGTAECHSLTCAGMLAANAKANYVLALLGAYDPPAKYTTFYANDVGVSLWRDGGIVASRTETDEQAEFDKAGGGAFAACGPPTGTCTAPLLTSKLVQYAAKLVDNETAAIRTREAAAAAAVPPVVAAVPVAPVVVAPPASVPAPVEDSGVGRILGWSLVGVGVAVLATGISLWALDGHASNKCASTDHVCDVYDTSTPGVILTAVGAAGVVVGGLLVWRAQPDRGPQLAVGLGSLLVRGRF